MTQSIKYDASGRIVDKAITPNVLELSKNIYENHTQYMTRSSLLGLSIFNYIPSATTILQEKKEASSICTLSFCLGERIEWTLNEVPGKKLSIDRNESCIMTGGTEKCISQYEEGVQYQGIGVSVDPACLQGVAECLHCENAVNHYNMLELGDLKHYIITPHVTAILSQIIDSNICERLEPLYLEAKLLELIAVYLDEMVYQRGNKANKLSLSKEDLFALRLTKEILDNTFVHPLTLSELSKKIYLNEYKLKIGFKQRYGQTVYGYILEKRMELARILLEQRHFRVGDVAGMVGYANTGHFISAFRKKYGVTPGQVLRNRDTETN
ncbi:AraC family transcriptional regulator [Clostridium sp. E02]|uniref:helix-turn-helix transcriptional regulator n=1 Tax=Clostridium sp. E02 TaxID=2487134 RepID=UPI000F53E74E|nr:AraC family transcriptional regulator [Clostridium sp. E02]